MAFGVYVHIPYCLQRCVYCDFATYEFNQIVGPTEYINRVENEIKTRGPKIGPRGLDTLYFGGGTPSLLDPEQLEKVITGLANAGFPLKSDAEVTLEINPATLDNAKLDKILKIGFNRFSVGAQTFDDKLLKIANRKHTADQTRQTLELLSSYNLNYSADLLFALPGQNIPHLEKDVEALLEYSPAHISPYCLTVPNTNPMAKNRAPDEEQAEMFSVIKQILEGAGFKRYEISNFAKPGAESRHNMLYWDDEEYWGIGLSAHSYMKWDDWGVRFWNPRGIQDYLTAVDDQKAPWDSVTTSEKLMRNHALTDFFHISLRKTAGLDKAAFKAKFDSPVENVADNPLKKLMNWGLIEDKGPQISLTDEGLVLSNKVFEELTFLSPG